MNLRFLPHRASSRPVPFAPRRGQGNPGIALAITLGTQMMVILDRIIICAQIMLRNKSLVAERVIQEAGMLYAGYPVSPVNQQKDDLFMKE